MMQSVEDYILAVIMTLPWFVVFLIVGFYRGLGDALAVGMAGAAGLCLGYVLGLLIKGKKK